MPTAMQMPPELNDADFVVLARGELDGRVRLRCGGGSLSGEDIRALVAEHFGVSYSLSGIYEVLHRAGLSWVSARSKPPQRDAKAQEAFKKTSLSE